MNKWLKVSLIVWLSTFLSVNNLSSQEVWEEVMEQLVNDDEENSYQLETLFEELADLREHPLPINMATKEQLERFPFLTDKLIENILYYLYKYGPMLTEKELMMVEDMDRRTCRLLLPFISFQQPVEKSKSLSLKQILKYGKQELTTRVDIPFYTKEGYQSIPREELEENPNKRYLGYSFYHNVRYSFRYSDRVYAGITMEKDAGEPFFAQKNKKGYDYYSPYLLIRNVGKINALALGNYRLGYGCGLVMNTDFNMGKTAALSTLGSRTRGIKKHSSTDEYNYFQGIAASYRIAERWTADAFYSYRTMDGIVDGQFITSLKKDGYHRIIRDFEKKNTLSNQLMGSHIHYNGKFLEVGLTGVYNVFNKSLNPTYREYNKYYARGRDFFNVGMDYKFFWKRFTLQGETAVDKGGRLATLNTLSYSPKSGTRLLVMNRFYDVAYQSIYARSVGEGSSIQNESGFYIGLETNLLQKFRLSCYGDYFYFPWKKYQLSKKGTGGFDGILQIGYSPTYQLDMFIRYRYKNKYKDYTPEDGEKTTLPYIQQRWKYQLDYSPTEEWVLKTSVNAVRCHYQDNEPSWGVSAAQSIGYQPADFPVRLDASVVWFQTDDYASRITMYEKGLLYSFSMPTLYGKGMRFALHARYQLNEHISLQAKYALTHYYDRETIGSGLEQIEGNNKSDLYIQLRFKF